MDRVGDFGRQLDDVVLLGKCDEIIRDLARELGWLDELMELWNATENSVEEAQDQGGGAEADRAGGKDDKKAKEPLSVDQEVEQLLAAIEHSLTFSQEEGEEQEEEQEQAPVSTEAESDSSSAPAAKTEGTTDLSNPEPPAKATASLTEEKETSDTRPEKEKL
jgi:NAD+-dependent protein deacetylase SIR2